MYALNLNIKEFFFSSNAILTMISQLYTTFFFLFPTGPEPIQHTAESLYFQAFQQLLSQSCPKINFTFNGTIILLLNKAPLILLSTVM